MAIKYFCDMCEKELPQNRLKVVTISGIYNNPIERDCCWECRQKVGELLKCPLLGKEPLMR